MSEDGGTAEGGTTEGDQGVSDQQAVADSIPRPENCPEKFWNAETKSINNDQVLESYNQLSTKFGAFTGAPESYDFKLSEDLTANGVELDLENPIIGKFTEMAKEANMSPEMANNLVNMFVEGQYADQLGANEAEDARFDEQMGILGDNAQQRVNNISNWAQANLTPEQIEGLEDATTTAAGVQAIEALIAKSRNAPMNTGDLNPASPVDMAEIQTLQFALDDNGNRKMATDPAYRKMVQEKMAQALPGDNIITVG